MFAVFIFGVKMKKSLLSLAIAVCGALALTACGQQQEPAKKYEETQPPVQVSSADMKTLVDGNNEFAFDLYARLSEKPGNKFFSPYSISTALAMTYAGARGNTAKEMAQTLHDNIRRSLA